MTIEEPSVTCTQAPASRSHVPWFEASRGLACLVVVWYHTVGGLGFAHAPDRLIEVNANFDVRLRNTLPVFFFISGMLAARTIDRPRRLFVTSNLSRLAYPYVVWSILSVLISMLATRSTEHRRYGFTDILQIGHRPVLQYWYLLALLLYLVLFRLVRELGLPPTSVLAVATVGYLALALDAGVDAYFPRMIAVHGGYMAAGIVVGDRVVRLIDDRSTALLATTAAVGIVVAGAVSWSSLSTGLSGLPATLGGYMVLLTVLCTGAVIWRFRPDTWLSYVGRNTLPIYVAHVIVGSGTRMLLLELGVTSVVPLLSIVVVMSVCLPLVLDALTSRLGIPFVFRLDRASSRAGSA